MRTSAIRIHKSDSDCPHWPQERTWRRNSEGGVGFDWGGAPIPSGRESHFDIIVTSRRASEDPTREAGLIAHLSGAGVFGFESGPEKELWPREGDIMAQLRVILAFRPQIVK